MKHTISLAISQMRVSALIALYHTLERLINEHLGVTGHTDAEGSAALRMLGCDPDENGLTDLRLAANVARHGEGNSAEALRLRRPELLLGDELVLSDDEINAFYRMVNRSTARTASPGS